MFNTLQQRTVTTTKIGPIRGCVGNVLPAAAITPYIHHEQEPSSVTEHFSVARPLELYPRVHQGSRQRSHIQTSTQNALFQPS